MQPSIQRRRRLRSALKAALPLCAGLSLVASVLAVNGGATYVHASDDSSSWVGAWGASPIQPLGPNNTLGTPLQFVNQTIRSIVNPHLAGQTVRIRISNKFGNQPITFTSVFIGNGVGGGSPAIVPGTNTPLTFSGSSSVTIQPGNRVYSDPAPLRVQPFQDLVISYYTPSLTGPATQHTNAQQLSYVAAGNQASATTGAYLPDGESWYFLTDVDVTASTNAGSVVTLGNSITDGLESTINANHRYPDFLAQRLQASGTQSCLSVVNEGIAGNRVLYPNIGPSTVNRLQSDVLSQPNVRAIILEDGINDLADPPFLDPTGTQQVTAQQVYNGLVQIANQAHARGIKVFATTLTPSGDLADPARPPFTTYSTPQVEAKRNALNQLIRNNGGVFDGVFDFELAVANPANHNEFNPIYANVDNFHPNDLGYQQLANTVNLPALGSCYGSSEEEGD